MNTIEIGNEADPAARASLHVISTAIDLESRVDSLGGDGALFHVRTIRSARRLVLASGLAAPAGAAVLDALDGLPDLPAAELADAVRQCAVRVAQSRHELPPRPALCALRVDRRGVQWAGLGSFVVLRRRRPSAWRAASVQRLHPGRHPASESVCGAVDLRSGDEILAWAGNLADDELLASLFGEAIAHRGTGRLPAVVRNGCLATLRRR